MNLIMDEIGDFDDKSIKVDKWMKNQLLMEDFDFSKQMIMSN